MSDPGKLRASLLREAVNKPFSQRTDLEWGRVADAARDYLALLESDALVIKREDGHWPANAYRVVNAYMMRAATTRSVNAADVASFLDALADSSKAPE